MLLILRRRGDREKYRGVGEVSILGDYLTFVHRNTTYGFHVDNLDSINVSEER